jgi:hypothetical protein
MDMGAGSCTTAKDSDSACATESSMSEACPPPRVREQAIRNVTRATPDAVRMITTIQHRVDAPLQALTDESLGDGSVPV